MSKVVDYNLYFHNFLQVLNFDRFTVNFLISNTVNIMKWIYLSIAVIAEVIATTALKESDGFSKIFPSILVVSGYGVAFYFLGLLLKMDISIGVVYAIWSGAGIVLVALIGYFIYQQQLNIPTLIGLGLIITGIVLVNVNTTAH